MRAMARTVQLVPLSDDHIGAVLEIERGSHGAPWSEQNFRNEMEHAHACFRVALDGTEVVGYAGMWLIVDEAHITTVTVREDRRRQGVGRTLVEALLAEAKAQGAVCATLEVRAGNEPAIRLYESFGFVRSGVRRRYYPDNREDAVVMWLHDLGP
jgi:ribosomal-protein-alanine N-acetyltransferase